MDPFSRFCLNPIDANLGRSREEAKAQLLGQEWVVSSVTSAINAYAFDVARPRPSLGLPISPCILEGCPDSALDFDPASTTFAELIPDPDRDEQWWDEWEQSAGNCYFQVVLGTTLAQNRRRKIHQKLTSRCESPIVGRRECLLHPDEVSHDYSSVIFGESLVLGCDSGSEPNRMARWAWAVLRENWDIVRWISCLVRPRFDSCLEKYLFSDRDDKSVVLSFDRFITGYAVSRDYGDRCHIRLGQQFCNRYVEQWNDGSVARDCLIADLAGTLLHEVVHCCRTETFGGDTEVDGDRSEACSLSYMIENAFRWAMGHRFPCLQTRRGCFYYRDACTFLADGSADAGNSPC